jgi:hypothetical protein
MKDGVALARGRPRLSLLAEQLILEAQHGILKKRLHRDIPGLARKRTPAQHSLRVPTDITIPYFFLDNLLADLLDVYSQAASHFGIKPTEMIHDLLVLGLHAFDNLHDDHILVVEVLHDVAGFFLALDVAMVIALGH